MLSLARLPTESLFSKEVRNSARRMTPGCNQTLRALPRSGARNRSNSYALSGRPASSVGLGALFLSRTPFTCTPWTPIVTRSPLSAATCLISPHVPAGLGPAAKYPRASAKLKIGDAGGSANTKSPLAGAFETAQYIPIGSLSVPLTRNPIAHTAHIPATPARRSSANHRSLFICALVFMPFSISGVSSRCAYHDRDSCHQTVAPNLQRSRLRRSSRTLRDRRCWPTHHVSTPWL